MAESSERALTPDEAVYVAAALTAEALCRFAEARSPIAAIAPIS